MKLEQAGRSLVSRIITLNTSARKKCGYPAGQQVSPARCTCMSSCTVEEILGGQVFLSWHARFGTCYIKPLMKIIRRAKKSVSSLLNSRPRKKTIESELLASCLVGDGREEQCASSEAPVKLPQSRPGHQIEACRRVVVARETVKPICMAV